VSHRKGCCHELRLISDPYHLWYILCGLSSLTCGENGEGLSAMAVRAATDGHDSIPPDGDEGLGP